MEPLTQPVQEGSLDEALQRIERQARIFDTTLSSIVDFAYIFDKDGRFIYSNKALTDLLGITSGEIVGKNFFDLGYPKDLAARLQGQIQQVFDTKEMLVDETPFTSPTGVGGYYEYIFSPVIAADGSVEVVAGSTRNITERKKLEQERERLVKTVELERSRFKYLFDKAPAFVAVLQGPEYVFELANPAYLQLVGHRELTGKTVREAFPEIEGQGFLEMLEGVYKTGEPYIGRETPILLHYEATGQLEERLLDFVYQSIFDADGSVSGIFVHGVDVTEQVQMRKAIEEANRLKDEFIATLSHELRNPLNSIIGYSEVLLRSPEVKQIPLVSKAAETIHHNAEAQAQLIDDLLDLSRLQTGKLAVERYPIGIVPVVSEAIETVRSQAIEKGVKLDVDLPADPLIVNADSVRLQQIVWNLVNNAVKFTPKGGRITVALQRENGNAKLVVEDTGQGIDAKFLPQVFEMFRQGDNSTTRRHSGMGIGLALVRQLTEIHGGQVEALSAGPGCGARFTVQLPLITTSPIVSGTATSKPTIEAELTGAHILIVDDSQDSLDMLRLLLIGEGAIVETALSGEEGLIAVKSVEFDLVISDISMPEMDGYEFLSHLRKDSRYKSTPAIALTGFGRDEDVKRARAAGFTTHLTKPLDFDQLIGLARLTLRR